MTFGDLKQKIVSFDLNRDDVSDIVADAAITVITNLQRSFFYATPITESIVTVPGQVFYPVPTNLVSIQFIRLLNPPTFHYDTDGVTPIADSGTWQMMVKTDYERLLLMDTTVPTPLSIPSVYAPYDAQIRIFQAPDKAYPLELTGNSKIPLPASDDDSNFWTENAAALTRYSICALVYQTRIKDAAQFQSFTLAAERERITLMSETWAKSTMGYIAAWW